MNDIDFEKKLKERLYNHVEPIDPNGWETLWADQKVRKRQKVRNRRFLYGSIAVAAILIILLSLPQKDPDPMKELAISIVSPPQEIDPSETSETTNSLEADVAPDELKTVQLAFSSSPVTEPVAEKENLIPVEMEETEIPEIPEIQSTPAIVDTLTPLPRSDLQHLPDSHQINDQITNSYTQKRRDASEGWSIALVSTYSNAAGEAPFSPTVQQLSSKTRTFYASSTRSEIQESTALSFSPPLSVGVNFQKELYSWLTIGVGMNYTLLQSKFYNSYNYIGQEYTIRQSLHYVGLPMAVLFNFIRQSKMHVYASAGGMVEKAVTAHSSSSSKYTRNSESFYVQGLQWSVNVGLGVEVQLLDYFGIYLEPGMGYFFDCNQPRSIRTIQPAQFKAELGLRVRI